MTALLFLGLAAAGGLGAALRMVLDGVIRARVKAPMPIATIAINVSGSLVLGLLVGLGVAETISPHWVQVLGVGLLGGYTTFSTASFETVRLAQGGQVVRAAANGLGTLVLAALAAGTGLWLGGALA